MHFKNTQVNALIIFLDFINMIKYNCDFICVYCVILYIERIRFTVPHITLLLLNIR